MNQDNPAPKAPERSYTLIIVVSFAIAVLMPVVRAVAEGDTEVAAAYTANGSPSVGPSALPGAGADNLSLLVVGAFLLGLGSVLRRVA